MPTCWRLISIYTVVYSVATHFFKDLYIKSWENWSQFHTILCLYGTPFSALWNCSQIPEMTICRFLSYPFISGSNVLQSSSCSLSCGSICFTVYKDFTIHLYYLRMPQPLTSLRHLGHLRKGRQVLILALSVRKDSKLWKNSPKCTWSSYILQHGDVYSTHTHKLEIEINNQTL